MRRINRALRTVNRRLRRRTEELQHETDVLFLEVCERSQAGAEAAMRELWERGDLDCSSQDYDAIVEASLEAIRFWGTHGRPKLALHEPPQEAGGLT